MQSQLTPVASRIAGIHEITDLEEYRVNASLPAPLPPLPLGLSELVFRSDRNDSTFAFRLSRALSRIQNFSGSKPTRYSLVFGGKKKVTYCIRTVRLLSSSKSHSFSWAYIQVRMRGILQPGWSLHLYSRGVPILITGTLE